MQMKLLRRRAGWVLGVALLLAGMHSTAQDSLPQSPDFRGEIRRGADGRLIAVPMSPGSETAPLGETAASAPQAAALRASTLVVGPGERIATITEAARQARDGDVVEIKPGEYRGQPAVWTQRDLTIRGVGKRPVMVADGTSAEGKAIWVVRGGRVRIDNIEFRGARVASGNGAGIRLEGGQLAVFRSAFIDNEMGILTANFGDISLEVVDSVFADAPRHEGTLHHLLYVGEIGKFVLRGSRFANGFRGHLVKSRARENHVLYNVLADSPGGRASYELEFPNGGIAYVIGNVIVQSADSDNATMVAFGAEGQRHAHNALYMVHNTLVNERPAGTFVNVWLERFSTPVQVWGINNLLVGEGDFNLPAQGRFEGNERLARGALIEQDGVPTRLPTQSPLRGSVRLPGQVGAVNLAPTAEFVFPVGSRPLRLPARLSPGAFQ